MIVKVKLPFTSFSADEQRRIQEAVAENRKIEFDEDGKPKNAWYTTYAMHLELAMAAVPPGTNISIAGIPDDARAWFGLISAVERMEKKLEYYSQSQQFNDRVSVHVPNIGLLLVDEVRVEYDMCTDSLNKLMAEEGWRIIACCPQPDQRRPDYVLGRTLEARAAAERR